MFKEDLDNLMERKNLANYFFELISKACFELSCNFMNQSQRKLTFLLRKKD